jgi:alanyl-tRNA synthetase
MGHIYPELKQRQDFIKKVIQQEEARFDETLRTGLEIIDNLLAVGAAEKVKRVSGADAFRLYDTYGFPVELTKEIVEKSGFTVDMAGFEKEMEKQRERARASHKFDVAAGGREAARLDIATTEFVGYHSLEQKARILKFLVDSKVMDVIKSGQEASLVLDASPFYAEMGGQIGDTGEIIGPNGRFTVTGTVRLPPDITVHKGRVAEGILRTGEEVRAVVDAERRRDIARNHTATHLLQAALRQVLGEHIQQRGSLVAPERLRFDFSHLAAMTPEEIRSVQRIVNERIRQNLPVYDEETGYQQAVAAGAIALFDEKYGDVVRVLKIGEPAVSTELCGGTHVAATGEIGYFHILSEGSIGAGLRRIEAVTGRAAEEWIEKNEASLISYADMLETEEEQLADRIREILDEDDRKEKRIKSLERELAKRDTEALLSKVEVVKGINVLRAKISWGDQSMLREMADFLRDKLKSVIIVLGSDSYDKPAFIVAVTPDLVEKGYNASDIVKKVSQVTGGGGGGRADFAQGSGKDKSKLDDALRLVRELI